MRAIDAGILICAECHELNKQEADTDEQICTRCGALVHARRPNSLMRTWALLITGAILYIPANVLPIMTVNSLGQGDPSTIMSGVIQLVQHGMIPIAAVVFLSRASWYPRSSWWASHCCCFRCSAASRSRHASAF